MICAPLRGSKARTRPSPEMPEDRQKEIARAVEGYYGVDVVGVNVLNIAGKRRRRAKGIAVGVDYRKAIVTVKKGQSIEIMPK